MISGGDYSIVCLGTSGQALGGFGGARSLNAWCADPRHTDGKHAPNPALIKGYGYAPHEHPQLLDDRLGRVNGR